MQQVKLNLQEAKVGDVLSDVTMAPYTHWKIGGPADLMIFPRRKEQLADTLRILQQHQIPWFIIGKGSNLLITDKGIRGAVIKLGPGLDYVHFDSEIVVAGGCCSFPKLSALAGRQGLTGLEFASGIPGTVGGAVYMNAGAHGSDVSCVLQQAEVMLGNGEIITLQTDDLQFAYRHSILQERPGIVTEAVFRLQYGDRELIEQRAREYRERRVRTQPVQAACAGSVFRNPPGHYAAKLIEEAGLKGLTEGGAQISTLHANFIVNNGQATAEDVISLISQVQELIFNKYGVQLVPEVRVMGER